MSFDLYVWKAPVPTSATEAGAWLIRADETDDDSFFRSHRALREFRSALLA